MDKELSDLPSFLKMDFMWFFSLFLSLSVIGFKKLKLILVVLFLSLNSSASIDLSLLFKFKINV